MLLAAPAALHIIIWVGVPVVAAIALSFTSYNMLSAPEFVGMANYADIFQDAIFWRALWHNVVIGAVGIPISMLIALILAVMLNQGMAGQGIFRTAIFLPHVTATVAIAMIWLWIYAPTENGLANWVLSAFGIPNQAWLTNTDTALLSVIIVTIWQGIGLKMLIYLAALQGIPEDVYEAAEIDGGNAYHKFRYITIPALRPVTFFVLVTSIIANFQTFDLIFNLTQGGPANATTVITYQIYLTAFEYFQMGLATAQSVILLVVLVILTIFSRRVTGGSDSE